MPGRFLSFVVCGLMGWVNSGAAAEVSELPKRTLWTTSRVVGSPEPPSPYQTVRVLEDVPLKQPIYLRAEPGTSHYMVVEHQGNKAKLSRVDLTEDSPKLEVLLEPDDQLYAVTFHPKYVENGYLFLLKNGPAKEKVKQNRIVRYTVDRKAPYGILPDSELVILSWESNGHNGGELAFGPEGLLYCPTGDGTSDSDPLETGQGVDDLLSVMIRIDVDHPTDDKPYSIPPDNPYLKTPGARPEIWAFGFRNPWRIDIDQQTGAVWVTQNGQDLWEQVYVVRAGENYGWSVQEGSYPFYLDRKVGPGPIIPPTVEHHHAEARSLTGGVVYTGNRLPDLKGAYIYGDYSTGRVWGVRHDGQKVTWHQELVDTPCQIAGFTQSHTGELWIVDLGTGIHQIQPREPETLPAPPFPTRLSETGIFESTAENQVQAGLIPYSVNSPLWSDGAVKERFIGLPGDAQIDYQDVKAWNPPEGTVLVKTFSLETAPGRQQRVETRLMTKQQGEWIGYSYAWNPEQTDAVLVESAGQDQVFSVVDPEEPGQVRPQSWHFPSRAECLVCHSRAAGFVLGLQTAQLNRDQTYHGVTVNQLSALDHWRVLKKPGTSENDQPRQAVLTKPTTELPRFASLSDTSARLEDRVRAYLHVNCAVCHQAAGGGNAQMELQAQTSLEKMKLVGETPYHAKFEVADAELVAPGDPARSILLKRMSLRGRGQMPPLASSQIDPAAVTAITEWIQNLPPKRPAAPFPPE